LSDLLFHWQREIYQNDLDTGLAYHFNQNSPAMDSIEVGESVWAFTRRSDGTYVLAARLIVDKKTINPPGHSYGKFRVIGDKNKTIYFQLDSQNDVSPLIRQLVQAKAAILGRSFQGNSGVRTITGQAHSELLEYSRDLRPINEASREFECEPLPEPDAIQSVTDASQAVSTPEQTADRGIHSAAGTIDLADKDAQETDGSGDDTAVSRETAANAALPPSNSQPKKEPTGFFSWLRRLLRIVIK